MKRKGFTLIELLAVIVILAIIALIAVPVIMNIISEARKSAFEDTAYGIISAGEMYYAQALLDGGMKEETTFAFIEDGVSPSGLNLKGTTPKSGSMKITTDGKIALAITNGTLCIKKEYDDSDIEILEEFEICELLSEPQPGSLAYLAKTNEFAESIAACATSGKCEPGTKFAIEVAPDNIQNFYVISDLDNIVTLIMDRNIGDLIAWISEPDYGCGEVGYKCSKNDKGPITALNYLESQTKEWTNIPAKTYIVQDENNPKLYPDIERVGVRTRMITRDEANVIISNEWAYDNLSYDVKPYCYWTSTAYTFSGEAPDDAQLVCSGSVVSNAIHFNNRYGVRPVIELSK